MHTTRSIAYFSMEVGLASDLPTYSGGLGMLAGDTLRAAADLSLPMLAVTLLHRQGFFVQHISDDGWQEEEPAHWNIENVLTKLDAQCTVQINDRSVLVCVWQYTITGVNGHEIPVYFLDTDLEENDACDRHISGALYAGDLRYRLAQEIVLGIGGVRMLNALGYPPMQHYHMNEGHAALLSFELLSQAMQDHTDYEDALKEVRNRCVFTTHTPVPAGHDSFGWDLVCEQLYTYPHVSLLDGLRHNGNLNMTYLALRLSHYVNGVAQKHGEVARTLLAPEPGEKPYQIDAITNGVHLTTWISPPIASLLDDFLPRWRQDHGCLRSCHAFKPERIWKAHQENKTAFIDRLNRHCHSGFAHDILTIGFARRFTAYKRPTLLFQNLDRLRDIARAFGGLQIVYAGKAHPHDHEGKLLMQRIWQLQNELLPEIKLILLPNYSMNDAQMLVSGVDLWLNTPQPPMEASGTSGMKAAANAVPSLSILDGWWIEGCVEGVTGWAIGQLDEQADDATDAASLYEKLQDQILPMYYNDHLAYARVMTCALSLNSSFFNTHRMLMEYVARAYTK